MVATCCFFFWDRSLLTENENLLPRFCVVLVRFSTIENPTTRINETDDYRCAADGIEKLQPNLRAPPRCS